MKTEEIEIDDKTPKKREGVLFVVSTPIGNDDDITLRALKVMKGCDIIVCEEPKVGARTLHKYNITQKMELLNEQNEFQKTDEILVELRNGKKVTLISDCGTPVFADPGLMLVQAAIRNNINVVVVPGATSIMTAIVRSGFSIDQFLFAGFLSRSHELRAAQLRRLSEEARTVVVLETPYRLLPLLDAARNIMPERHAYVGCNLTMGFETHHYGTFSELFEKFSSMKFKGEFVLVFEGEGFEESFKQKEYPEREERPYRNERRGGDRPSRGSRDRFQKDRPYKGKFTKDRDSRDGGSWDRSSRDRDFRDRDSRSGDFKDRPPRERSSRDRDFRDRDSRSGDFKDRPPRERSSRDRDFRDRDSRTGDFKDRPPRDRSSRDRDFKGRDSRDRGYKDSSSRGGGSRDRFSNDRGSKKKFSGDRPKGKGERRSYPKPGTTKNDNAE